AIVHPARARRLRRERFSHKPGLAPLASPSVAHPPRIASGGSAGIWDAISTNPAAECRRLWVDCRDSNRNSPGAAMLTKDQIIEGIAHLN
ncbi:MAG TPA: hypothetical protein VM452_05565, partial [Caulifigura sp.]|nr:hypothetical protein [Caulifigura sp.]